MTVFRAIACRAAKTEETYDLAIAQLTTLGGNVECNLSAHFAVENEVRNENETQSVEVDCEDDNHVVQPRGLKKNAATTKGKRRVKGGFEAVLVANSRKKACVNTLATSQSIAGPTVRPSPLSVGGDVYSHQHVPHFHLLNPSVAMGGNLIPLSLIYPTYHANNLHNMYVVPNCVPNSMPQRYYGQPTFQLVGEGLSRYDIGFRYSEQSNSPMCSQAIDQHKQVERTANFYNSSS
ncbi:unnamed protein product [Camellia sinensis]